MRKKHEAKGKVSQWQVETLNQTIHHPPDLDNRQNFHYCTSRVKTCLTFFMSLPWGQILSSSCTSYMGMGVRATEIKERRLLSLLNHPVLLMNGLLLSFCKYEARQAKSKCTSVEGKMHLRIRYRTRSNPLPGLHFPFGAFSSKICKLIV